MDINKAILFAKFVNVAYAVAPDDLAKSVGTAIPGTGYTVMTTIYSNDLATEMNPNQTRENIQ